MKTAIFILLVAAILPVLGVAQSSTNAVHPATVPEAIRIASGLRLGMAQMAADDFLFTNGITDRVIDTNGKVLVYWHSAGDKLGWTTPYPLAGGCFLNLEIQPRQVSPDPIWGPGILKAAKIQSNGVDIVSIRLKTAP